MPGTRIARCAKPVSAATQRNDELIALAANRAEWARTALITAARDLDAVHGVDGRRLTSLAEVILEEAARVSNLAEDIDSHRAAQANPQSGRRRSGLVLEHPQTERP